MYHSTTHVCTRRGNPETGKERREAPISTRDIEQRAALELTTLQQSFHNALLTPIDQRLVDGTIALPLVVLHVLPGHAVVSPPPSWVLRTAIVPASLAG
jgi:hypothetical protein